MSDDNGKSGSADPLLIAVIVIVIVAAIFFIIAISISFSLAGHPDLEWRRSQIAGAGVLLALAAPMAIVSAILTGSVINARSQGKEGRGQAIAATILSIVTILFVIIASILLFVTANQIDNGRPDEAASLRGAGALSILGLVLFTVGFAMFMFRAYKKLPKAERKQARSNVFRRRTKTASAEAGDTLKADATTDMSRKIQEIAESSRTE